MEALAQRRPPSGGPDQIGLDTPVMTLVEAHLARLADDGRAPATQATYRVVAGKLRAKLGGVRVGEAAPARIDTALRSMSHTHGPVMARQAKTILRGGLQLAVLANVLGTNPVRDVQQIKSKRPPKGAPSLTAEQLRDLLVRLRASEYCREHGLADPFTILVATGLRRCELLGLRWGDFRGNSGNAGGHRQSGADHGQGADAGGRNQDRSRSPHDCPSQLRHRRTAATTLTALPRQASGDHVPVHGGNMARPEQLWQRVAHRPQGPGCAGGDHAQLPEDARDPHRRGWAVCTRWGRSPWALQGQHDAGRVHERLGNCIRWARFRRSPAKQGSGMVPRRQLDTPHHQRCLNR